MADRFDVDVSDLAAYARDLEALPVKAAAAIVATSRRAGKNIRDEARRFATGLSYAPLYPSSITYETSFDALGVKAEIGPDKNLKQGALGNLLEYGSVNNAPHAHLAPAYDREVPVWIGHVETAAGDL